MNDAPAYDSQLPILAELEAEITRVAAVRLDAPPTAAPAAQPVPARDPAPDAGRARRRWLPGTVVPRRAAALAVLVCLVGTTATAGISLWRDGQGGDPTEVLAQGGPDADGYKLSVSGGGERLCATLLLTDNVDTVCASTAEPFVRSVLSPRRRYVYGFVGSAAVAAEVSVGSQRTRVPLRAVPDDVARQVPAAAELRWFVTALPRTSDRPVTVAKVRFRGGDRTRTIVDCSLGQRDPRCGGG